MSYCVNCGVELEESQKSCPLCAVEVCNPAKPYDAGVLKPYSSHIARINRRVERRFDGVIASVTIAFVAGICIVADMAYSAGADWSLLVAISLGLGWMLFVTPFVFDRLGPLWFVGMDMAALIGFLYGLNRLTSVEDWFTPLALPVVLSIGVLAAIGIIVIRAQKLRVFSAIAWVAGLLGTFVLTLECILDRFLFGVCSFDWSFFVAIPCFVIALIFTIIARKVELQEAIIRRLHV
ncbi:MAG: DUF6320 domain-containing protein [Bacillota bacterium]